MKKHVLIPTKIRKNSWSVGIGKMNTDRKRSCVESFNFKQTSAKYLFSWDLTSLALRES